MQSKLKKSDLLFTMDENGDERITLQKDFATKNHQGGLNGSETTTAGCITDRTQIAVIKCYRSKLHLEYDHLFQRALGAAQGEMTEEVSMWYMRMGLGHNVMGQMMKRLSVHAVPEGSYTNHSFRASVFFSPEKGQR